MKTKLIFIISLVMLFVLPANFAIAHCDTKDGPVVADARKAIEQNNVNYVLKWVQAADEKEITEAFELTMKVRVLSPEAEILADNYFFETLDRYTEAEKECHIQGLTHLVSQLMRKFLLLINQ